MECNGSIFNRIAEALLVDYSSVYYVDAVTNAYQWYSIDPEFKSLNLEPEGSDFFKSLIPDVDKVIYEEDKHIFLEDLKKDNLMTQMKKGTMQDIIYRLMIDGKPVYHSLRVIRGVNDTDDYFILGIKNVDKEVKSRQEAERIENERDVYNQIAESLADHFDDLFYVDTETNKFYEFSSSEAYRRLRDPALGDDFFDVAGKNIGQYVYEEDREKLINALTKEVMLKNLADQSAYSLNFRLCVDGKVAHHRHIGMWASDHRHIIICVENIDEEVRAKNELDESRRASATYGQIATSLASRYSVIYYVDTSEDSFMEFSSNDLYRHLEIPESGVDFFGLSRTNINKLVHREDRDRLLSIINKDYLITALEDRKRFSVDYRLVLEGKVRYTRLTVLWSGDHTHFIIAVENIDEQIMKEQEHLEALRLANELARRDELTGVGNNNAYRELADIIQADVKEKKAMPFALVVFDVNDLKYVNDNYGHKSGDVFLKKACQKICDVYSHSPVFRIGGDEFVAILTGKDYNSREDLLVQLRELSGSGSRDSLDPVIASGMAAFAPETDKNISDVFERADSLMYEDKRRSKGL